MARTRAHDVNGTPMCAHFHLLTPDNVYTVAGLVKCRQCRSDSANRSQKKSRAERRAEKIERFLAHNAAEIDRLNERLRAAGIGV